MGGVGAYAHDYYLKLTEMNALREQRRLEMREKRFLEDKEKYGDRAYDIQRRDTTSMMPSWWPIRAVSDEEYEKILDAKVKILERRIVQRELEEKERQARIAAQRPPEAGPKKDL